MLRAVKDHLADSLSTFPQLMDDFKPQSLHFYMANLTSMRKLIAPELSGLYQQWLIDQSIKPLRKYAQKAKQHWPQLAGEIIKLRDRFRDDKVYIEQLANLIEKNYL